jgi:hypothetical protein
MENPKRSELTRTTLCLPPELWKSIRIEAIKRDETATTLVIWALEQWLQKKVGKP